VYIDLTMTMLLISKFLGEISQNGIKL